MQFNYILIVRDFYNLHLAMLFAKGLCSLEKTKSSHSAGFPRIVNPNVPNNSGKFGTFSE